MHQESFLNKKGSRVPFDKGRIPRRSAWGLGVSTDDFTEGFYNHLPRSAYRGGKKEAIKINQRNFLRGGTFEDL